MPRVSDIDQALAAKLRDTAILIAGILGLCKNHIQRDSRPVGNQQRLRNGADIFRKFFKDTRDFRFFLRLQLADLVVSLHQ